MNQFRIFFGFFFIITIISGSFYFPHRAEADVLDPITSISCEVYLNTIGSLFETVEQSLNSFFSSNKPDITIKIPGLNDAVPVVDEESIKNAQKAEEANEANRRANTKVKDCEDNVRRVIISTLKQRLLDVMVDDTVQWIQNGDLSSGPRFVTNFNEYINNAGKAAVGDLAQELNLGFLCSSFSLNIRAQLSTPAPFSKQASCTLDTIVGNTTSFYNNFKSGGWLGYSEVLKPQNNQWGAEVLVQQELWKKVTAEQNAAAQEVQAGNGYTSAKNCTQWYRTVYFDDGENPIKEYLVPGASSEISGIPWNDDYYNKTSPPSSLGLIRENGGYAADPWICTPGSQQISTPGDTVKTISNKAVTQSVDYIISSDDLSAYLTAIGDALINRLTKESIAGLKGVFNPEQKSSARGSTQSQQYTAAITEKLGDVKTAYDQKVANKDVIGSQELARANAYTELQNASSSLSAAFRSYTDAKTSNDDLIYFVAQSPKTADGGLLACLNTLPVNATTTPLITSTQSILNTASSTWNSVITSAVQSITSSTQTLSLLTSQWNALPINTNPPLVLSQNIHKLSQDMLNLRNRGLLLQATIEQTYTQARSTFVQYCFN